MGVLGKYGANAVKYWGSILASAYANVSTADMWTAIRSNAAEYGFDRPGASAPDVSVIRGFANRIVAGATAFAAADQADSITPAMMGVAPYTANDLNTIATAPTYSVRYQVTVQSADGDVATAWQTSIYTAMDFPDTVGGLLDSVQGNAEEIAAQVGPSTSGSLKGTVLDVFGHEITVL